MPAHFYLPHVADEIAISENLDVVIGARFDSFDIEVFNADPDVLETRTRKDEEVSPRAGVIYKPKGNISIHASYSESFLPRSGEQFTNTMRLQLNVENLTDRLYFPNSHSTHQATVAPPLNARLSLIGEF